jgi:hypothetical protein
MAASEWLQDYASVLVAAGNFMLVIIWGMYLQMFYRQSQREQEPAIVIHRAQGPEVTSSCLLINMSREVVHIECVIAEVETENETRVHQINDYHFLPADESRVRERLRQGPLHSGELLLLGSLDNILPGTEASTEEATEGEIASSPLPGKVQALELRVVAFHGPSKNLVGARRRFSVERRDDRIQIVPEKLMTEQLTSRRDRGTLRRWLRDSLAQSSRLDWPAPSQRGDHLSTLEHP